jgi:hypothetical protein
MAVSDQMEIRTLIDRYSHLIDAARYDEWIGLFTVDGEFIGSQGVHAVGSAGLRKFTEDYHAIRHKLPNIRHLFTNVVIDVDGATATACSYGLIIVADDAGTRLLHMAVYDDELRIENGAWRFSRRRATKNG